MTTNSTTRKTGLDLLREPFPANQISKLCRSTKKDNPKGKCNVCGGWHGLPAVSLDYVGHAAVTARLLDADPNWNWEFAAVDEFGLPVLDAAGGLWIKLTVCGITRLGYGDATNQSGGGAMKERIGDALRNAAMRFGVALDLWHKGELYAPTGLTEGEIEQWDEAIATAPDLTQLRTLHVQAVHAARAVGDEEAEKQFTATKDTRKAALDKQAAASEVNEARQEGHDAQEPEEAAPVTQMPSRRAPRARAAANR